MRNSKGHSRPSRHTLDRHRSFLHGITAQSGKNTSVTGRWEVPPGYKLCPPVLQQVHNSSTALASQEPNEPWPKLQSPKWGAVNQHQPTSTQVQHKVSSDHSRGSKIPWSRCVQHKPRPWAGHNPSPCAPDCFPKGSSRECPCSRCKKGKDVPFPDRFLW